jgi:hypothetical protein
MSNLVDDQGNWVAEHAVFRPCGNFPQCVLSPGAEV